MGILKSPLAFALTTALLATPALSQEASFAVTLGKDTVAIEKFIRTGKTITGEMASRFGAAGNRLSYAVTLGADGRATSVSYRSRPLTGAPAATAAREIRITFLGDSVKREAVYADSINTRMLPAAAGVPFVYPAFGLLEVALGQLRRAKQPAATLTMVGLGAGTPASVVFTVAEGDTIRAVGGGGVLTLYRADKEGRLLAVDASGTTQKLTSTRNTKAFDFDGIASRMTPLGALSSRGVASGSFLQSVVFINYGRPQVRGRTVWGGLLVPPDTIWRLGANEATHLATSRELSFGSVVLPAGLYTLWLLNKTGAPELVINQQVGQWGTSYDATQDLVRLPVTMGATAEFLEDFTITLRNLDPRRGAIEFAWGDKMATATFSVAPRP